MTSYNRINRYWKQIFFLKLLTVLDKINSRLNVVYAKISEPDGRTEAFTQNAAHRGREMGNMIKTTVR